MMEEVKHKILVENQWLDVDTMDEAQSDYYFAYMGRAYCIELTLSVAYGDVWFANLFSVEGEEKQKCVSAIKISTCESGELSWLKRYLEKRMDLLLLELEWQVPIISFEPENIAEFPISFIQKKKLLDMLQGLWIDIYKRVSD